MLPTAVVRAPRQEKEHGGQPSDRALFEREILPAIRQVPLRELMRATGLSLPYVSQIQRGEKVPHPRHWPALMSAGPTEPSV
jgi:hypothetical protein